MCELQNKNPNIKMFCDESVMNYELDFIERLLFEPTLNIESNNNSDHQYTDRGDLNQIAAMRKNQRERMRVSRLNREFEILASLVERSSWYQMQHVAVPIDPAAVSSDSDKENWCKRRSKTMTKLDILRQSMRYIAHLTHCLNRNDVRIPLNQQKKQITNYLFIFRISIRFNNTQIGVFDLLVVDLFV